MTKIFTDTSANLPIGFIKKYGLNIIPFAYSVDGAEVEENGEFDGKAYYSAMRAGAQVKTSMISTGVILNAFKTELEKGFDIIYIAMSGGISGTVQAAEAAADELRQEFPERNIAVIDTFAASLGEGLLAIKAAEMNNGGISFNDIASYISRIRHTMCQYFTVDDLKYLKRGGRISGTAAAVGTLLNIKPILKGDETGHIISCGRARGKRAALLTLAEHYEKLSADKRSQIGIAHADAPEDAETLLSLLKKHGFKPALFRADARRTRRLPAAAPRRAAEGRILRGSGFRRGVRAGGRLCGRRAQPAHPSRRGDRDEYGGSGQEFARSAEQGYFRIARGNEGGGRRFAGRLA